MHHFVCKKPSENSNQVKGNPPLMGNNWDIDTVKMVLTYLGRCFSTVYLNWVVVTVNPSWNNSFCFGSQWKKANNKPCVKFSPSVLGKTNVAELVAPSRAGSGVKGQPHVYAGVCECPLLDPTSRWLEIASPALVTAWFKMLDRKNSIIVQKTSSVTLWVQRSTSIIHKMLMVPFQTNCLSLCH